MRLTQLVRLCLMTGVVVLAGAAPAVAQGGGVPSAPPKAAPNAPTQPGGGQTAPFKIYGTIVDKDGKPMSNVDVQFSSADNGQKVGVVKTDTRGDYQRIVGVPGNKNGYWVVPTFGPYQLEPAKVLVTYSKRVNFVVQRSANSKG